MQKWHRQLLVGSTARWAHDLIFRTVRFCPRAFLTSQRRNRRCQHTPALLQLPRAKFFLRKFLLFKPVDSVTNFNTHFEWHKLSQRLQFGSESITNLPDNLASLRGWNIYPSFPSFLCGLDAPVVVIDGAGLNLSNRLSIGRTHWCDQLFKTQIFIQIFNTLLFLCNRFFYFSRCAPFSIVHSCVDLVQSKFFEEWVLGLVDEEFAWHGSKIKLRVSNRSGPESQQGRGHLTQRQSREPAKNKPNTRAHSD